MITKYTNASITDVRYSSTKLEEPKLFSKLAKAKEISDEGYLYVQTRAISSRVNKNNDGWPSEELTKAYGTFEGRPVFIDHNNENPERTRGVVVWSDLHVEEDEKTSGLDEYYSSAPSEHLPPTWIELLIEVDANEFPKLAKAITKGKIDAVSMGANIESTICSICANTATTPEEYCNHIQKKGMEFEIESATGEKVNKRSYEDCYGVNFFEISFVFDPADETALISEYRKQATRKEGLSVTDELTPQADKMRAPERVDTLRRDFDCPRCGAEVEELSSGIKRCEMCGWEKEPENLQTPDLERAHEVDRTQDEAEEETGDNRIEVNEDKKHIELDQDKKKKLRGVRPVNPVSKMAAILETTVGYPGGIHLATMGELKGKGIDVTITTPYGSFKFPEQRAMSAFMAMATYGRENGIENWADLPITIEGPDEETVQQAVQVILGGGRDQSWKRRPNARKTGIPGGVIDEMKNKRTNISVHPRNVAQASFYLWNKVSQGEEFVDDETVLVKELADRGVAINLFEAAAAIEKVAAKRKRVIVDTTKKKKGTDEPREQKVKSDQKAPVESKNEDDMKESDRKVIKRQEEDGDGVKRTEEIIEESGPLSISEQAETEEEPEPEEKEEPEAEESSESEGAEEEVEEEEKEKVPVMSTETHLLAAMKLAKLASALGVIENEEELNFVATVEDESMEQIEARVDMLRRVKEAGLARPRKTPPHVAKMPSFTASNNGNDDDDILVEQIFLK